MQRGEIRWASLPRPRGSEPSGRRPLLVIQSDPFNASRISTVVVAAITSNLKLASAPGSVSLSKRGSGLSKDSVVNVSQLFTLDRSYLSRPAGRVSQEKMSQIDEGLRLVLSL